MKDSTALVPALPLELGSPLPMFRGDRMAEALTAYKELQRALDHAMPDQVMHLDGKPFRKKGYWRAVAVAFNLDVELVEERREEDGEFLDGRPNFGYLVTYRAKAPNGRAGLGDGACFAVEKAGKFKCPHPERPGARRTLHWPPESCPDFEHDYQWLRRPAGASVHNIRAHAHTRAFNRAVSNLVGFGEVSAEEVERAEPEVPDPAPSVGLPGPAFEVPSPPSDVDVASCWTKLEAAADLGSDEFKKIWDQLPPAVKNHIMAEQKDKRLQLSQRAAQAKKGGKP